MQARRARTATVFAVTYLAYACIYIARLNLSIAAPALTASGAMNEAQIGLLGSIFSVVFAIGRLLNGVLNDKLAPWIMLCSGLAAVGCANLMSGVFLSFAAMAVLWGVNAYAQSMMWGSVLRTVTAVYPAEKAGKRTAAMVSSVAVGNLLGILLNTWVIDVTGRLEMAFILPGGLSLLMCPIAFAVLRRIPFEGAKERRSVLPWYLLKDKSVRRMLVPAFCHGVMKDNISLWMAAFFVTSFGIDLKNSSWFLLFIPALGLVGRVGYSAVYRLCGEDQNKVSTVGFILCTLFAAVLCLPFQHPVLAMLCLGVLYAAVSLINTSVLSIYPLSFASSGLVATVSGFMDFGVYLAAGIGSAVYGAVIAHVGYGAMFASWVALSLLSIFFLSLKKKQIKKDG